MSRKLSLADLDLNGKRVLMRVDFNVPLDAKGSITDDTRIKASLPSILHILHAGGALILMSHLGRPKDQKKPEFSLAPCAKRLSEILGVNVKMAPDCIGPEVVKLAEDLQPGEILLLENLRFHKGEEKPDSDPSFAKSLADLGDVYVNDAFGTAHRAHASTAVIAQYFPGASAAGFLLDKEIQFLGNTLLEPRRPFAAIIGGSKISTKIGILKSLIKKVDTLLIGGGMAYTFFKAQGWHIGNSLHEDDQLVAAREILRDAKELGVTVLLPVDNVITDHLDKADRKIQIVESAKGIPENFMGVDIGPKTIEHFKKALQNAGTILWNGPLGIFEQAEFAKGTNEIAKTIGNLSAVSIVGGGDSIAALQKAGLSEKISHISTGGGASLEYIELGTLPGIEALSEANTASKK